MSKVYTGIVYQMKDFQALDLNLFGGPSRALINDRWITVIETADDQWAELIDKTDD